MKENYDDKYERRAADDARRHKAQDDRMRYGKKSDQKNKRMKQPG